MKKFAVIMLIVLILLMIPSGIMNLRRGVFVEEQFYAVYDNGDNSWTYRSEEGDQVNLDWCGTGTGCFVSVGNTMCSVQLDWTKDRARLEFDDGTVLEGRWTGEALVDEDGKSLWVDNEESIQLVGGDEEDPPLRKYDVACMLCKMDQKELVAWGMKHGTIHLMLVAGVIYILGMLNVLYPEKMHFLGRRWKYDEAVLSDAGRAMQVFKGIVCMILGAVLLYIPLFG